MSRRLPLAAVGLLAFTGIAVAQSLAERERMAEADRSIANQLITTNQRCGTQITVAYDWATVPPGAAGTNAIVGACNPAVNELVNTCSTPAGLAAVRAKIQRIACSFGDSVQTTLGADGTLRFQTRVGAPDQQQMVRRTLQGAL